jgi:hypothetical protein
MLAKKLNFIIVAQDADALVEPFIHPSTVILAYAK